MKRAIGGVTSLVCSRAIENNGSMPVPTFALWHKKKPWRSTRGKGLYHKLMGIQGFGTFVSGAKAAN
jgi:hypothetical protein